MRETSWLLQLISYECSEHCFSAYHATSISAVPTFTEDIYFRSFFAESLLLLQSDFPDRSFLERFLFSLRSWKGSELIKTTLPATFWLFSA
jgi:hypothetical protein